MSEDELDDLIDFWHLEYEGELELDEFMSKRAGWSLDDTRHWLATGRHPHA